MLWATRLIAGSINGILKPLGYEIRKAPFFDMEQEAMDNISRIRSHTMVGRDALITLYQQVAFCETNNIPGCFVECGTWKGGAVALMAIANQKHGLRRRHLHLFDSFGGIPEPVASIDGRKAVREAGGEKNAEGRLRPLCSSYDRMGGIGTLQDNITLLEAVIGYDPAYLHFHKGWFQETLPKDGPEIGEIAILRLDCDWYASTALSLKHLYDHVVPGGFIIIDDYGCYDGCRKAVDEFIAARDIRAYLNHVHKDVRYWIKP